MSRISWLVVILAVCATPTLSRSAENEGQPDLDAAVEAKLAAKNLKDLSKVVKLCESAVEKGLDKENAKFANKLLSGALYERAALVTDAIFKPAQVDPNWPRLRAIALLDLERATKIDNGVAEVYLLVGQLESLPGGNREKALKALGETLRLAADDKQVKSKAHRLRASVEEDEKKRLDDYNESVKLTPEDVEALRARAAFLLDDGKLEAGLADLDAAIKIAPDHGPTHEVRGLALIMLKKYDEAIAAFDLALKSDSESVAARTNRARALALKGDLPAALKDLERAVPEDNPHPRSLLLRASIYQQLDKPDDALADCERALEVAPDFVPAIRLKAVLLASTKRMERAIRELDEARRRLPDDPELPLQLAMLYQSGKQASKAIELCSELLKEDAKNQTALRTRGDAQISLGKHAEGLVDYEAAYKLAPKNSGVLNNLAWLLSTSPDDRIRNGKRAVELATEACQVTDHKLPHILSTLAAAYAEAGDWDNAVKWSKKAVDMGDKEYQKQLEEELKTYQAKKPFREFKDDGDKPEPAKPAAEPKNPEDVLEPKKTT